MKNEKVPVAELTLKPITRRNLLQGASAATVVGMVGSRALAGTGNSDKPAAAPASSPADKKKAFPDKFLWGCATAGHQVEGNNTSSDLWLINTSREASSKNPRATPAITTTCIPRI